MSDPLKSEDQALPTEPQLSQEVPSEPEFNTDIEYEIVRPEPEETQPPPELVAAQEQLKASEEEKARLAALASNNEAVLQAVEAIKNAQPTIQPVPKEEAKPFNLDELKRTVNDEFYSNPSESILKTIGPFIAELNNRVESVNKSASISASKADMLTVDENRDFYKKYRDEIEQKVASLPPAPDIYQRAINEAKLNHLDDIIAEKAAAMVEEQKPKLGTSPPPQMTNVGKLSAPPKPARNKVNLGPRGLAHKRDLMQNHMITNESFAEKSAYERFGTN